MASSYLFDSYTDFVASEYPRLFEQTNRDPQQTLVLLAQAWRQLQAQGQAPLPKRDKAYRLAQVSSCTNLDEISSDKQLYALIPRLWDSAWQDLSDEDEIPGLEWYTSDDGNIHPKFKFNAQQQRMVNMADEEVRRGPKPEHAFVVVRGIHGPEEWKEGQVITPRPDRLHSASFDLDDVTAAYVDYEYEPETMKTLDNSGCCICEIIVPQNSDVASHFHESQVIFPIGASFLVLHARRPKVWESFGKDDTVGTYTLLYLSGNWKECLH